MHKMGVRVGDHHLAEQLRGFGPVGLAAILLIVLSGTITAGWVAVPVGGLLVLAWTLWSETPWPAIGYRAPNTWALTILGGIVLGIGLKLLLKALILPLLGAQAINPAYHYLAGNTPLLPAAIWAMLVAGFGEETVFRGFLFERFGKLFGGTRGAKLAILIVTSLLFALAHFREQGLAGVEQASVTGLVFGGVFLVAGNLWVPMIAHAAFDLTALAIIYGNLEADMAHWIFT
jgi:CAAX protease family protein